MTPNAEIIHNTLRDLPLDDRLDALACTVIERRPQCLAAVISLTALVTTMARWLNTTQRFQLAEALRDAADRIERMRALERVV